MTITTTPIGGGEMPNQKITDCTTDGWYTEVSWRRQPGLDSDDQGTASGHVQLATVNLHSPFEFPEKDTGDHFEAAERFDGWRVTLNEEGITALIKTLHKAKRQAFGGECGQVACDHAPDGGNHPVATGNETEPVRPGNVLAQIVVVAEAEVTKAEPELESEEDES